MKFIMLLKADAATESGAMPGEELLVAMGKYNQELIDAGVLLAGEGLHPSSRGARVYFENGQRRVVDGPFAETKELVAGFWIIQVASKTEAIDWASRVPFAPAGASATTRGVGQIELRQLFEASDFAPADAPPSDAVRQVLDVEQAFRDRTNT